MSNPHHEYQQKLDKIRYPNGYLPKIEYYQAQLSIAVDSLDMNQIKYFTTKLEWFINRKNSK